MTRSLTIVPNAEEPSAGPTERPLSLLAQPGRPGHVLVSVELDLDGKLRNTVNAAARDLGLPAGLVAAITIDAVRHSARARALSGLPSTRLADALDAAAGSSPLATLVPQARRLAAYARALRTGGAPSALAPGAVRLPVAAAIAAAWALAAAGEGEPLSRWAVRHLLEGAPSHAVAWEIAAAESGSPLGEWVYAAALRDAATASPHART